MDQDRLKYLKGKYPTVPEYALPISKKGSKKSLANQLTQDIIDHAFTIGAYGMRINSSGTYSEKLGRFILSGSTKGVSDVIIVHKGLFIAVEVKINNDRQSDKQKRFQEQVESAGGRYMIAKTFDQFKADFEGLTRGNEVFSHALYRIN